MLTGNPSASRNRFARRSRGEIREIEKAAHEIRKQRRKAAAAAAAAEEGARLRESKQTRRAEEKGHKRLMSKRVEVEYAASLHPEGMVYCTKCGNVTDPDSFCDECGSHPAGSGRKRKKLSLIHI